MKRRTFIANGSVLVTGYHLQKWLPVTRSTGEISSSLYSIFKNPDSIYKPFVRWWWNGDRIEKNEIARELRLLKEAGIGGVEISPVKFPARTDSMNNRSVEWLSDEWIDLLQFALNEAKSLGLVCDLIVGSGWPYGAEWLDGEERSEVMVVGTRKLEGPLNIEISLDDLFKEADPPISSPFAGRKMEMISVTLMPASLKDMDEIKDLSDQIPGGTIRYNILQGKYVLYAMVKITGFMQVIQGAPGATGPVLNHYNESAVKKYLTKMSDTIQQRIGPLSSSIRALFTDSLELEGANWCKDMAAEFQKRRGYDILPYMPYILFKIASMGNTWSYDHGAEFSASFREMIERMRYDFELTKTELIEERFAASFIQWCKENKVQSRMQAYGRGYYPLEGSFDADIPECETWIRKGLGEEMSETDYFTGRAYTVVNKFVSSAAHLKGKRHISCEELTNIHQVFNETLELMKIAGDQSIISGTTHPIFHGFNYSPPDAAFPGWVLYGTFINEKTPWWPWFRLFTEYKSRLSALLQQATMFADIAILPPTADLWSKYSAQNDPFPAVMYPEWQTYIWEAIHQDGGGCDYISEKIIRNSTIRNGYLEYGQRRYHTVFFTQVETMEPDTAKKLYELASAGVRLFFIGTWPAKACGWKDHEQRDHEVQQWIGKIKILEKRCFLINKPGPGYTDWYRNIREKYRIPSYLVIDKPEKFVTQIRYQAKDSEIIVLINSNSHASYLVTVTPSAAMVAGKQGWIWDAENGNRYKLKPGTKNIQLDLGPADLKLLVFDKDNNGTFYQPAITERSNVIAVNGNWSLTGKHINGNTIKKEMSELRDLKEMDEWVNFCGVIVYTTNLVIQDKNKLSRLNLGKVYGVAEVSVNGKKAGVKWYGRRIYDVHTLLVNGNNSIEIKVTTTMGNYLKSMKDNPVAQYWTNEGRTIQPLQSAGIIGPVTIY